MRYQAGDLRALATLQAGVAIPALQAGVTGLLIGSVGGALAAMAGADALNWGALTGGLAGLGAWLAGVSAWRDAIYRAPESVQVYQAETASIRLSIDWDEGRAGLFADLNITDDQFITWACGVAAGRSLGENHWCGAVNPFSKGSYHAFLARLEFYTVVRRAHKGKNSPYVLTAKGQAICSGILNKYGPAAPHPSNIRYLPGANHHA